MGVIVRSITVLIALVIGAQSCHVLAAQESADAISVDDKKKKEFFDYVDKNYDAGEGESD